MIGFRGWLASLILRLYLAIALVIAAVFAPPALSFIPILLIAWHLYLWWRPLASVIRLLTDYFAFFAVNLLLTERLGPLLALLVSLPILVLVTFSLNETAASLLPRDTRYVRVPTRIGIALPTMAILALAVSLMLGSLPLLLSSLTLLGCFSVIGGLVLRRLPSKPVEETPVDYRMVAGSTSEFEVKLNTRARVGGQLFLESPYPWLRITPSVLQLRGRNLAAKVWLSPTLSGPSLIRLKAYVIDHWGLVQVRFELEPVRLYVIPRARYAAWVAKRYLAETRPGRLPLVSNVAALRPLHGLRRGVEYYGSRLYQVGDSIRYVDWKHSLRHNEIVVKEFAEFQGQSAIVLINLAVSGPDEADDLAYKIIATALTLAQDNIPAALAAYNHEATRSITGTLGPQQLVVQSLEVTTMIVIVPNPVKYLDPPDVSRLRANIERLRHLDSASSSTLAQLLQMEYRNLESNAKLNPATRTLSSALVKADRESNIVVISQRNHDAEALAFGAFDLVSKGRSVINL